jgi:hypothetical protein
VEYLVGVAKAEPRVFCALLAKLLPGREDRPTGGAIAEVQALSDEALATRLALVFEKFAPQGEV